MTKTELQDAMDEHGPAFQVYADNVGHEYASLEDYEESFEGVWDGELAFAEEMADSIGMLENVDNVLARYFDWDMWTRDLFMSDYYSVPVDESWGPVYVFRNV